MVMAIKRGLFPAAVALGLIGSFFLPNIVAGVTDAGRIDSVVVYDAQSVSFDSDTDFSLPERIVLAANSNSEALPLTTGQMMEMETAQTRAIRELARFLRNGPFVFETGDCVAENGAATFVIDSENPAANMIVWEFTLTDRYSNEIIITIDDETGIILKLIFRQGRAPTILGNPAGVSGLSEEEYYGVASRICEMMNEYYGIFVVFGDYTIGSNLAYYRADMYGGGGGGGGTAAPMYGVVRSSGFTMNERH